VVKKSTAKKAKAGLGRASSSRVMSPLPKAGPTKKVSVLKISHLKARHGPCGMSATELTPVKHLRVSKKFCLLDVAASSQARATGVVMTCTGWVPAYDNLSDDSSPDACDAPSPGATMEKYVSLLPSASSEFLHFSFTILTVGLDGFFLQTLSVLHLCQIFCWKT
jgi:hypothetical protein